MCTTRMPLEQAGLRPEFTDPEVSVVALRHAIKYTSRSERIVLQ